MCISVLRGRYVSLLVRWPELCESTRQSLVHLGGFTRVSWIKDLAQGGVVNRATKARLGWFDPVSPGQPALLRLRALSEVGVFASQWQVCRVLTHEAYVRCWKESVIYLSGSGFRCGIMTAVSLLRSRPLHFALCSNVISRHTQTLESEEKNCCQSSWYNLNFSLNACQAPE